VNWLPEELNWSATLDETTGVSEEHCGVVPHFDGDLSFPQPLIYVSEIRLQVVEEQRWLCSCSAFLLTKKKLLYYLSY